MCGTSDQTDKAAADQKAWTSSMKAEATQVFGTSTRIVNDLVDQAESIWNAGPSQQGFSAAEQNAKNAAVVTNAANLARFNAARAGAAGAVTPGGVGRFGGGQETGAAGGRGAAVAGAYQDASAREAAALNQIQQENWATGRQNWLTAGQTLQSAPGVFNAATPFNAAAQTGLDKNMANAQAADAASNWWVKPVEGLVGAGLGMATGGLGSMAMGGTFAAGAGASLLGGGSALANNLGTGG